MVEKVGPRRQTKKGKRLRKETKEQNPRTGMGTSRGKNIPYMLPSWLVVGTSPILQRAEKQCFPGGINGKESSCQCKRHRRHRFNLWVRKVPGGGGNGNTPVFLPEESQGQRSLMGYRPWGHEESDRTEQLTHNIILQFSWDQYFSCVNALKPSL